MELELFEAKKKENLIFLEYNKESELLESLEPFYLHKIYMYKNFEF